MSDQSGGAKGQGQTAPPSTDEAIDIHADIKKLIDDVKTKIGRLGFSRDISIGITHIETGALWIKSHVEKLV